MKIVTQPFCTLLFFMLLVVSTMQAQDEREIGQMSGTFAITNATIISSPGRRIDEATLIIKDGLIHAVGKNISVPPDAIVINGDSLFVYAGFIDGLSRAGVLKPRDESKDRIKDPGNPPPDRAGITPQNDVRDFINPTDKSIEELRAIGFTTAQVVPHGLMLPGSGAVISLSGKTADDMVLTASSSFYSELTPNERVYPLTVIGVMAKWRELYKQAQQAKTYAAVYASNGTGLPPPAVDRILESFYPVIDKHIPVLFKTEKFLDVQRVLSLQKDLGFQVVLGNLKEGWDAVERIKSSGIKVFLSLELPEEKKKMEENKEIDAPGVEKATLEKRKLDFILNYVRQPAVFQQAGIVFAFSGLSVKSKDIQPNLRRMIKAGLTEDQALAALTTNAAQLLGLSDRLGSIDPGKIANIVISERPYFHEKSKVKYVFVEGVPYKTSSKDIKKESQIKLEGEWRITTNTPQGKSMSTLTVRKKDSKYSGSLTGDHILKPVEIDDIKLEGTKLSFGYTVEVNGQPMKITLDANVEGDAFKGTMLVEGADSIPVEGKKVPKLKN